jgi:hypothetical protein
MLAERDGLRSISHGEESRPDAAQSKALKKGRGLLRRRNAKGNKVYACLYHTSLQLGNCATSNDAGKLTIIYTHAYIPILYSILLKVPKLPAQYHHPLPEMPLELHCHSKDVVGRWL